MKSAWTVETYIRASQADQRVRVPMMQLTMVFWGDAPPSKDMIRSYVNQHTKNVTVLFSEVVFTPIPDDILPPD